MRTQTLIKEATEAADRGNFDRGFVYSIAALAQATADGIHELSNAVDGVGGIAGAIEEASNK